MSKKSRGIVFIILSALSFAFMSLFIKLSGNIPTLQKSFFRNLVAAFVAFYLLRKKGIPLQCSKKALPTVVGRALFGTLGIFFNFYAIDHLHISDASMLNKLSPFFAILFSFFLLHERVKPYQIVCVFCALAGALFILKPDGTGLISFPALIGLLGGMCAGLAYTLLRKATGQGVAGTFIVFFFSLFSCLCSLPYCLLHFTAMTPLQLFFLLMTGVAASFGQFFITAAYTYAPARELSVYDYSNVIFSGMLGFLFLGELPDHLSYIGCAVIIITSVVMFQIGQHEKTAA
ncbi:MAG: DMT family transporter [Clostridiaceae bacterium]|nr:DMT family transporter [Clostridiaceae bacterium]